MTAGGWVFMISSITVVTATLAFCFYRVLRGPSSTGHADEPPDTDTHDADN